jgi:hypothetical protein
LGYVVNGIIKNQAAASLRQSSAHSRHISAHFLHITIFGCLSHSAAQASQAEMHAFSDLIFIQAVLLALFYALHTYFKAHVAKAVALLQVRFANAIVSAFNCQLCTIPAYINNMV